MIRQLLLAAALIAPATLAAQTFSSLAQGVQQYVSVPETTVALTHVRVVDGTGAAALEDRTVIIENGRITAVGPASAVKVPTGARTMDLAGHTVVPGFVGMHNHTFYTTRGRSV